MPKFAHCLVLLLCGTLCLKGQNILSPPPNGAAMAKMVDNPVSLHTGVPAISIPLYTLSSRKLSFPISISYNASGIKVSEVAGPVGLGWSINAPNIITRTVRGRPDEWSNSYLQFANSIPNATDLINSSILFGLADGAYDMQPDVFYYSTGMEAGKFVFDNNKQPQTIPKQGLKITFDNDSTLAEAVLTTYDGTRYIYIGGETAASVGFFGVSSLNFKSSWYLSRIISVDNSDTIKFNYTTTTSSSFVTLKSGYLYFYYDVPASGAHHSQHEIENMFGSETVSVTGTKYLASVESSRGKVTFQYGTRDDEPDLRKLDTLIVYYRDPITSQFIEDKRINFSYSYFGVTSSRRLKLDSLQEYKSPSVSTPPYKFAYSTKPLPATNSKAQDPWGYYNGATSNQSLVPAKTFLGQVISTSDRGIHPEFVDGCILSKIISPLGGTTEYFFQPNTYGASNAYGPGLRVSKIVTSDPFSNISAVTNYDYSNPATGTSSGVLLNSPSFSETHIPVEDIMQGDTLNYNVMLLPVGSTGTGAYASTPLVYEYVTVYKGDDYNVSGKSTSRFSIISPPSNAYPYFPQPDNGWKIGSPVSTSHYKVESNTPTIVSNNLNTFSDHPTHTTIKGLNAAWNKLYIMQTPQVSSVVADNYFEDSKFHYLSESKSYSYEQNNGNINALSIQKFYYERTDGYYLPNRITATTSESGDTLKREFTYPIDYAPTGVLGTMCNLNMISYPVESRSVLKRGSTEYVIGYQKTDYFAWPTSGVYPKEFYRGKFVDKVVKSTFLSNPSIYQQKTSSINQYDSYGFPLETAPEGGSPSAVIIDHKHYAPVARIGNATSAQVAYSSFETSDHGNWNVNAGSEISSGNVIMTENGETASLQLSAAQTVTYTYTVNQSAGPRPILTFSKIGETDVEHTLTLSSGNGNVSLTAGTWNVELSFDTNVTSVQVNISYSFTHYFPPNIVSTDSKTGAHCLSLTSTHTVSKSGLTAGDYRVSFYQKNGSATFTLTGGGALLGTETTTAGSDGWEHITKRISISSPTDAIQLTGLIKIDELRLYPEGSFMSTICYDARGRIQTETDMNLRSQFYEYDDFGRMKTRRDHDRNILQYYEYNLANN